MTDDAIKALVERLQALLHARKPYPMLGGTPQTMGCESWKLVATGYQFAAIDEAATALLSLAARVERAESVIEEASLALHASGDEYGDAAAIDRALEILDAAREAGSREGCP